MAAGHGVARWQRFSPPLLLVCWLMPSSPWSPLSLASQEEQHFLQSLAVPRRLAAPSTGQRYPACMGQDETLSRKHQVLRVDVLSPKGGRAVPRRGLYPPSRVYVISSS